MDQEAALLTFKREGDTTVVMLGDVRIGRIVRKPGSDSSPRGGAYRTFHHPITATGQRLGPCWSRKEAVEDLLREAAK
jgi:hypothetical protein